MMIGLHNRGTNMPVNWLFWNVRGMNRPFKQKKLRIYLNKYKISLAGILETKVKQHKFNESLEYVAQG